MVACFLRGELSSQRFGEDIRSRLVACGQAEQLLTHPDLSDAEANAARRALLAATRRYSENRDLFEDFPAHVRWTRAVLSADEAAKVRCSGGARIARN